MKQKLTKFLLLAIMMIMGVTSAWAEDVYTLTPVSGSNNSYTDSCDVTVDGITWNITGNSQMDHWRLGGKSINGVNRSIYSKTAIPETVTSVTVTNGTASSITVNSFKLDVYSTAALCAAGGTGDISSVTGTFVENGSTTFACPSGDDWTGRFYRFTYNLSVSGSSNKFVQFVKAIFEGGATPTDKVNTPVFTPASCSFMTSQEVEITCSTDGAAIQYSTDDGANWTNYSAPFTVTETTTVIAKATKTGMDDSNEASATYTKVEALTTMDAIFAASETTGSHWVTLDNWVVTGVGGKNNANAYVTDGTKGFIVYNNAHGLSVGDVLSGTVQLALTRYNGAAEATNLTSSMSGLTVTTGGTVTPQVVNISDLSAVNTGAVITVNNVTYDGTNLVDENSNGIKPYNAVNYAASFTNGNAYNVTGVYVQYNSTPEIAPRSAADIVDVTTGTKYAINITAPVNGTVETSPADEALEDATVTITATPAEHYSLATISVVDEDGDPVAVTGTTFIMPAKDVTVTATFAENTKYTVSYTSLGTSLSSEQVYAGEKCANVPSVTNAPAGWTFTGWTTADVPSTTTAAPTQFVPATDAVNDNLTLKALFKKTEGGGASGWTATELTSITPSDVFVMVGNGEYAVKNDKVTSGGPALVEVTIADDAITSEVTEDIKWKLTGNNTDGYVFISNADEENHLYCSTTASSGSNTNIRIGAGDSNNRNYFVLVEDHLKTNDTYTDRYIGINGTSDFRGYVSASTNSVTFAFYKYGEGGTTYYTTEEPSDVPTHTLASTSNPVNSSVIELSATVVEEGATATAEATPNAHFTFQNWTIEGAGATLSDPTANPVTITMGTEDATVIAHLVADPQYNLTYHANGGVGEDIVVTEFAGENIEIAANTFTAPAGKKFAGWNDEDDGSGTDYAPGDNYEMTTSGLDLYAVWEDAGVYETTYTSNVTLSVEGGTSTAAATVVIDEENYNAIKAGASKAQGAMLITVPQGTKTLHVHAAGWSGENITLAVKNGETTIQTEYLTADTGISGSSTTYTLTGDPTAYYFTVDVSSLAAADDVVLTFAATSGGNRFVIFGVNAEAGQSSVATPEFSLAAGVYTGAQTVTLSCTTENSAIYYTTDGTSPIDSETRVEYEEGIVLNPTSVTTIKAVAAAGGEYSNIATAVYTVIRAQYTPAELLAELPEPTTDGIIVTVVYDNEEITNFYEYSNARRGFYVNAGEEDLLTYATGTPDEWLVGGTVSGTVSGLWKLYNTTKEFCPTTGYEDFTYTAPSADEHNVVIDPDMTNGTVNASVATASQGTTVTLTIVPDAHCTYTENTLCVLDADAEEVTLTKVDDVTYTFIMPGSDVLVSADFEPQAQHTVMYVARGIEEGSEDVYDGETLVDIPQISDISADWTFLGWTENDELVAGTTAPELVDVTLPVTKDMILYAVYTHAEGSSVDKSVEVVIADYAAANEWVSETKYLTINADENITIEITNGSGNTGKYYSSNETWRLYQSESAEWQITAAAGNTLKSATHEYIVKSGGVISYGDENVATGTEVVLSGSTSGIFSVGNTGTATNGNIQITKITVEYQQGDGVTYYALDVPANVQVKVTNALAGTFVCPFALDFTDANVRAYVCTGMGTNGGVTMHQVNKVAAETPLYVAADEAVECGVPVLTTTDYDEIEGDSYLIPNLTGKLLVIYQTEGSNTNYILQKKGSDAKARFYKVNHEGNGVGANRAYLQLPATAGAKEVLDVVEEGDATGINRVDTANAKANATFDLSGRKVNADYKGIVIVNGKKQLIK